MSLFNDIVSRKNDENCITNAEQVKKYAMKFLPGHWTFLGPGSEEKWGGDSHDHKGQWNCTANKTVQRFKGTGHLVFKSSSAWSGGILKQRKGKYTIHFNGDFINTEILFQTVNSVNELSVYGPVANWCYQFGLTEEEKGRGVILVDSFFDHGGATRSGIVGISSDRGAWKQDAGRRIELGKADTALHNSVKKPSNNVL